MGAPAHRGRFPTVAALYDLRMMNGNVREVYMAGVNPCVSSNGATIKKYSPLPLKLFRRKIHTDGKK
jgi:hypothetical protein